MKTTLVGQATIQVHASDLTYIPTHCYVSIFTLYKQVTATHSLMWGHPPTTLAAGRRRDECINSAAHDTNREFVLAHANSVSIIDQLGLAHAAYSGVVRGRIE